MIWMGAIYLEVVSYRLRTQNPRVGVTEGASEYSAGIQHDP